MLEQDGAAFPLVSIIIRSMDRSTLSDALDSVALQTYPNIEGVVVNAKGADHSEIGERCGRFPLRLVERGKQLNRCSAANVGLEEARGDYLIFLDDDDLFCPEHIATLVVALRNNTDARCAYTGVRVEHYVAGQLEVETEFNEPFDRRRLWGRNFIPMHAMLFEQSLLADGCRFDEDLDLFEDWDFWVQLAQHTEILHIDKISAIYRNYGHSGLGLGQDKDVLRQSRGRFFEKWKARLTGEQLDDLIQYREDIITDLHGQSAHLGGQLAHLNDQLADLRSQLAWSENQIATLQNQQNRLMLEIHASTAREKSLHKTIADLAHSTSWKITAPLRFSARIVRGQHQEAWAGLRRRLAPPLKGIYWRLPGPWRYHVINSAYRIAGPLFAGMGHYEAWRVNVNGSVNQFFAASGGPLAGMVDLLNTPPLTLAPPGRIAIHAHIFYSDLTVEFADFLRNMPFPYDLYVSTPNEAVCNVCKQAFSTLPQLKQLVVTVTPNRGRDIAPMFCSFGEALQGYDYIAHIHSKKSLHNNGATSGWREYLLTNLLGSKEQIRKIFALLTGENSVGFVYPQNFSGLPYSAYTWLSNRASGHAWCNRLGIANIPLGYFDFPAGSMFWARTEALRPLFDAGIRIEDFPEEAGQNDATLAHCLERLLVLVTRRSGFNAAILRDIESNSWSRWRFEHYLMRKQENVQAILADATLRVVVFDIFDTLLVRPLLNPEHIKTIIAQRAGGEAGKRYLELRATAETRARQKAGRDIGLDAIFEELASLSGLSLDTVAQMRHIEETIELKAVTPRPEAIALLQLAMMLGKRVILASDMYLPRSVIESMLITNGITAWHVFHLSSEIGLRKDTGDLYRHIMAEEKVVPSQVIVIGDNEHSDVQIPGDMGMRCLHVMRPVELARANSRLAPLIEDVLYKDDLNAQLTFGMVARENFRPLFFPHFDPSDLVPATPWSIGFTVAGPLVLSFVQWLAAKAVADGIQQLFFLAREGQILKIVYDQWVSNDAQAIASEYLVLSRRAVTVPMISNLDDILEIARTRYFPNHLSNFIHERYGLTLSEEELEEFVRRGLWSKNKFVSVENKDIRHLVPLLQVLESRILAHAKNEHSGLLAYLNKLGLGTIGSSAIVDVGYSATIQGRLNRLMNQAIHGYYLVTEEGARSVASQHGVVAQGCFGHYLNPIANPPAILRESFSLEKLLSSDDAQIVCYKLSDSGAAVAEFRHLSDEERQVMATRAEIRRGMMDFVGQAIAVRDELVSDFVVPPDSAMALFETFFEYPSKVERDILGALTLDDHYCGRGLVS